MIYTRIIAGTYKIISMLSDKKTDYTTDINVDDDRLIKTVDSLHLSYAAKTSLQKADITLIGELIQLSEDYLLNTLKIGWISVNEIKKRLSKIGLTLGITINNWVVAKYKNTPNQEPVSNLSSEDLSLDDIQNTEELDSDVVLPANDSRLLKNIEDLDLSVRSLNCLKSDKIKYIGDLVQKTESYLLKIPNMGRKSLNEIKVQLKTMELSLGMEISGWPPENLEELVAQQHVQANVPFKDCIKEIENYIQTKCTDIEKSIFQQRIKQKHGTTLQALAENISVTRERIRQIETKVITKILRIIYKNISFLNNLFTAYGAIIDYSVDNSDDIVLIRQNCELLYNLLKDSGVYNIDFKKQWLYKTSDLPAFSVSESNLYSMDELVDHISDTLTKILKTDLPETKKNFTIILNKYIKQIIIDNFIFIDGRRTEKTKSAVFRRFLSQYSLVPTDIDYLFKEYSAFLMHNNISLDKYGYSKFSTFSNMVAERHDTLLSLGHKVRYYNYNANDIKKLIEQLNLSEYKDIEISCNKLFDENKELMAEHNILNVHELHNLLKKHYPNKDADFSRMPIIRFGKADREQQVINFAHTMAPISTTDLAEAYEETFGIPKSTFIANYAQYLRDYTYRGTIVFDDVEQISEQKCNEILSALTKDFYFIHDVEVAFKRVFSNNYYKYMNQATLKSLGFYMTSQYIMSMKYISLREYINTKFDAMPILDLNIYNEYKVLGAFGNWFYSKRNTSDLIKFAHNKYISSKALSKVGITKDTLIEYTKQVLKCTQNKFFTIYSISNMLNSFELENFGFEDIFYEDVLMQLAGAAFTRINNVVLFKNTSGSISLSYFVVSLMEHFRSINIYDLIMKIKEEYGILLTKHDITSLTEETDLYYNNITENLYINYDEFITSF